MLPNKRGYAELQGPIQWLVKAGLVYQVKIANTPSFPLESYCTNNKFKLYIFDSGILGAISRIPIETIYRDDYGQAKGVFAENICLQLLVADQDHGIYSWQKNTAEIEFLKVIENTIVPIEVKANYHVQAKSLKSYIKRYQPELSTILSSNQLQPKHAEELRAPLYFAEHLEDLLK